MKFNCDYFKQHAARKEKEREEHLVQIAIAPWQETFAWLPVRVAEGDCRWLEKVEYRSKVSSYSSAGDVRRQLHYRWFIDDYVLARRYRAIGSIHERV